MKTIILTRPKESPKLEEAITKLGVKVLSIPFISIVPTVLGEPEKGILTDLTAGKFDWLIFASVNGVNCLGEALGPRPIPARVNIGAVGPKTGDAVFNRFGRTPKVQPNTYTADDLARALAAECSKSKVLLTGAKEGREVVANVLTEAGAQVTLFAVYETRAITPEVTQLSSLRNAESPIYVCFSPSAVNSVCDFVANDPKLNESMNFISIGPTTSQAVVARGANLIGEAKDHTEEGVITMIRTCIKSLI